MRILPCPSLWHFSVTPLISSATRTRILIGVLMVVALSCITAITVLERIHRRRSEGDVNNSAGSASVVVTDLENPLLNYGVVVDCGSSGSRIYVYFWPPHDGDPSALLQIQDVIDSNLKPVNKKVSPGISAYADKPSQASDYLRPLLRFAADHIPKSKHKETPLYIMATAGMRMLSNSEQKAILDDLRVDIPLEFDFLFSERHAEVITGKEEGVYSWIAINYVLGKFHHQLGDDPLVAVQAPGDSDKTHVRKRTVGMLDMGGGSVQIAFEVPNTEDISKNLIAEFNLGCTESDWGHSYRIYVTTFLGYGANAARECYEEALITDAVNTAMKNSSRNSTLGKDVSTAIIDPCLPIGFVQKVNHMNTEYHFRGAGSYLHCETKVKPLLNLSAPCEKEPCSMNGVFQPRISSRVTQLYGFSEFYYTMEDTLRMAGVYDYSKFRKAAENYCSTKWSTLQDRFKRQLYPKADQTRLRLQCFKSAWMTSVLHDGFKVLRSYKHFTSVNLLNGKPVSWTLGGLLYKTRFYPLREIEKHRWQRFRPQWLHPQVQYAQYLIIVCFLSVAAAIWIYLRRLRIVRSPSLSRVPSMSYFMTEETEMPGARITNVFP